MAEWQYSAPARRFRDAASGRFIAAAKIIDLRDGFQERRRGDVNDLTRQLADQDITVQEWERQVTQAIRELHTAQFAFGRGGINAMTDADWLAADELVQAQRVFLRGFAEDVAAGRLSEAQITARAKLYYGSSVQAFERGRASAFGVSLPAYPADGSTPCKSACRCRWVLVDKGDEIHATWKRQAGEACSGCRNRASAWSPLVIARSDGADRIVRLYHAVA